MEEAVRERLGVIRSMGRLLQYSGAEGCCLEPGNELEEEGCVAGH